MKNCFTIIFLLLALTNYGQTKFDQSKISERTNEIVRSIELVNRVKGRAVGVGGKRPEQYDNFVKLKDEASTKELLALTNHPNPAVRCYSFWALSYNRSVDLLSIALDHINDTASVEILFGCIGGSEPVGEFFITLVTPGYIDSDLNKLDSAQLATLDSILISTRNFLPSRFRAFRRVLPTENLYPKIRESVINENNFLALVTLAKYQKEQDVELLLNYMTKITPDNGWYSIVYKVIIEFHHPDFLPVLEKNLEDILDQTDFNRDWKEMYQAIAGYRNDNAATLLEKPFNQVKDTSVRARHLDIVFELLQENMAPAYDYLLWKFWAEENKISPDIFKYLANKNLEKAIGLTSVSLQNTEQLYDANTLACFNRQDTSENLVSLMLSLVLKHDRELGIEAIRKNIAVVNFCMFSSFAREVIEIRDTSFIEPLFSRFEKEKDAEVFLEIAKALLAYKNTDINTRIILTRKKNEYLNKDWGGIFLDKLLQGNKIE